MASKMPPKFAAKKAPAKKAPAAPKKAPSGKGKC